MASAPRDDRDKELLLVQTSHVIATSNQSGLLQRKIVLFSWNVSSAPGDDLKVNHSKAYHLNKPMFDSCA